MDKHGNYSNTDLKKLKIDKARCMSDFLFFVRYFFREVNGRKFVVNWHHVKIAKALEKVIRGECNRLIINIAPRYSKTEMVSIYFVAYCLAMNPRAKFMLLSYSDDLVLENSERVLDILNCEKFKMFFPDASLKKDSKAKKKWKTEFNGGLYTASTGSSVTGFGAGEVDDIGNTDIEEGLNIDDYISQIESGQRFAGGILIDDPIKVSDADYNVRRDKINHRFNSTIRNRANSRNTPIVLIMQRVHPEDLAGFLMDLEPGEWDVLKIPCIYSEEGERKALWPFKHTLDELDRLRKVDPIIFDRQYQQDPQPLEGLCFPKNELNYLDDIGFDKMMELPGLEIFYGDPADAGEDHYSVPMGKIINGKIYIHDWIFTKDNISLVEPRLIVKVGDHEPVSVFIEANNAGALHIRDMRKNIPIYQKTLQKTRVKGGKTKMVYTKVRGVKNTTNKMIRIISQEGFVKEYFVFRSEAAPDSEYGKAMKQLWRYLRNGKEKRDDSPDSIAGMAQMVRTYYAMLLNK